MPEIVVPDALAAHAALDDERLSLLREMVGRRVYDFDGSLDEGRPLAAALSEDAPGPVLLNDIVEESDDLRIVDVYMHQNGRQQSVSKGVEQPHPQS